MENVSIPRIIHQTWKSAEVPARFQAAAQSWRDRHPGWEYVLWTDADIDRFVHDHFPQMVPLFRKYPDQIQRVDAFRYLLLYRVGGIFADLDIECLRSFESLRAHRVVLAITAPVGLSNDLMMGEPGHPLFQAAIDGLPAAFRAWQHWWIPRHFRVLLTTSSLYITHIHRRTRLPDVHLLPPELYSSQDRSRALVFHLPGDSWAGWDTRVLKFLYARWRSLRRQWGRVA
jgi:inositol phosphorylceramide mannosyltransferase catalytic subunit